MCIAPCCRLAFQIISLYFSFEWKFLKFNSYRVIKVAEFKICVHHYEDTIAAFAFVCIARCCHNILNYFSLNFLFDWFHFWYYCNDEKNTTTMYQCESYDSSWKIISYFFSIRCTVLRILKSQYWKFSWYLLRIAILQSKILTVQIHVLIFGEFLKI